MIADNSRGYESGPTTAVDASDLPSHAHYIGIDGEGDEHYYSSYASTVWVDGGDSLERHDLDETPIQTPGQWRDHVAHARGEWEKCLVGPYPEEEIAPLAEAVAERYGVDHTQVTHAVIARRAFDRVREDDEGVEAAISAEIEAVDAPVDSEAVLQVYADRYGGA